MQAAQLKLDADKNVNVNRYFKKILNKYYFKKYLKIHKNRCLDVTPIDLNFFSHLNVNRLNYLMHKKD